MAIFLIIVLVLFIAAGYRLIMVAKQKHSVILKNELYGSQLIQAGFLQYVDAKLINSHRQELYLHFNIYNDTNYRIAHIDAEELAEMSFDFFMPALYKMLAKRNIQVIVKKLNDDEGSNDVLINDDTIKLYQPQDENFWDTASRNFFSKLNEILKAHNSNERFYLLYGGNDLHTMLLTDEQYAIIAEYYKNKADARPYLP